MRQFIPAYISELYVMLTERCPLNCEYCYIKDRRTGEITSIEAINSAISLFPKLPRSLVFFGGEPLLELDLIQEVISKYGNSIRYQTVTSGVINFKEFLHRIYLPNLNNFDLQISWDGYTKSRGETISDATMSAIETALQCGAPVQVRCVISESSVEHLPATFSTLNNLRNRYPNQLFYDFTVAHTTFKSQVFISLLQKHIEVIFHSIILKMEKGESVFIPKFLALLYYNTIKDRPVASCDAGKYLVMRPNGDLYPCTILSQTAEHFKIGNVYDRSSISTKTIMELQSPCSCQVDCEYSSLCDGGCRYERYLTESELWRSSPVRHNCDVVAALYKAVRNAHTLGHNAYPSGMARFIDCCLLRCYSQFEYKAGNYYKVDSINNTRRS